MSDTTPLPIAHLALIERAVKTETKVEMLEKTTKELHDDVKHIRSVLDQSKGGVRMALAFASVAGALGGAMGWVVSNFKIFGGAP